MSANELDVMNGVLDMTNEEMDTVFDDKKLSDIEDVQTLLEQRDIKIANEDGSVNMQYIKSVGTSNAYLKNTSKNMAKFIRLSKEKTE